MPTIHTKTSLKKIKKDELIKMILDQQAKLNDIEMDLDDERSEAHHWKGKWFYLKDQYDKLKEEIDDWHKALNEDVEGLEHLQSEINLHFWRRCKGPWDRDIEKINQNQ